MAVQICGEEFDRLEFRKKVLYVLLVLLLIILSPLVLPLFLCSLPCVLLSYKSRSLKASASLNTISVPLDHASGLGTYTDRIPVVPAEPANPQPPLDWPPPPPPPVIDI